MKFLVEEEKTRIYIRMSINSLQNSVIVLEIVCVVFIVFVRGLSYNITIGVWGNCSLSWLKL